jgi:hypothetical protein
MWQTEHVLQVRASDLGTRSVTLVPVTITVTDVSQDDPRFAAGELSAIVRRSTHRMLGESTILQLNASDPTPGDVLSFSFELAGNLSHGKF